MKIFTHTTGRTGSAWLAELFRLNTDWECHHERLEWYDYGINTPDIRQMRAFNEHGVGHVTTSFWSRKINDMPENYVETAHMLCKAGLLEMRSSLGEHRIIRLWRPLEKVVTSMVKRGDYVGHGNHWLWYLDPEYPNNLVDSEPFKKYGAVGLCAWYWHEMNARAPCNSIHFEVGKSDPKQLLIDCGVKVDKLALPERMNASYNSEVPLELETIIAEVCEIVPTRR